MLRYRLACTALTAALGLLPGCATNSSCCSQGPGLGHGEILAHFGLGRRNCPCECTPVCSSGTFQDGAVMQGMQGPVLEDPNALLPGVVPRGVMPTVPTAPVPVVPQAQPMPAPPSNGVSRTRILDTLPPTK
jgi:hypothetical protein